MQGMLRLSNALGRFVERVGVIAAWSALVLVAVIIIDVVGRHFFSTGSSKLQELEWHLHTILFMFCLGLGYVHNTHVRIEIVSEKLGRCALCIIEILGCLLMLLPFCFVVIYYGMELTQRSWEVSEISSSATGLPYRWLIKSAIPLGTLVLAISGISILLRNIVRLFRPDLVSTTTMEVESVEDENPVNITLQSGR
ncbi:C4-dicarboxylate ABC transporter permease [Neopusillimonas maritima]|jgi:TRAP-type mannitol/chloroaromatic compound transport system permease small subunit|uniref:TRAP transporter small permease protein n=2 Tax=Neopusillimonas maritima TaxID=2026239 RepID=A0A3A1YNZ8_9BURK|nr:C4-dicarboxylate ABC transporter permease [Neopusillimonas maritima]